MTRVAIHLDIGKLILWKRMYLRDEKLIGGIVNTLTGIQGPIELQGQQGPAGIADS